MVDLDFLTQEYAHEKKTILEAYTRYQNNIREAERLQVEIINGLQKGKPAEEILPTAIEAIARMTDNDLFRTTAKKYI